MGVNLGSLFGGNSLIGDLFGQSRSCPKCGQNMRFENSMKPLMLKNKIAEWNTGRVPMMYEEYFTLEEREYMNRTRKERP